MLITGVTGYLGRNLCQGLTEAWHQVVGTSRDPAHANVPGLLKAYAWDPATQPLPTEALEGVDAVVHLVGESVVGRWTAAKKRKLYDSRVESARNIVRGMHNVDVRPKVFVGGSAVGYYGDRGDQELTEAQPQGDDFLAGLTADWEQAATEAESLGVRVVNSRTGLVVGAGAPFLKPLLLQNRLFAGGPLGSGKQWWPWVHIFDFVGAMRFALENEAIRGPMNLTSPNPARQRDFAKALGRVLKRPTVAWAPAIAIRLVLGEMANEVLTSKRALPKVLQDAGYEFRYEDLERALREALGR
ncbi:MAG: TIGR01777 family oxidoreductase [Chloroflexi bacterium]|nr:TIGR01777 family oxidoreductase [Chloroflexota bacterium]